MAQNLYLAPAGVFLIKQFNFLDGLKLRGKHYDSMLVNLNKLKEIVSVFGMYQSDFH